MRKNIKSCPEFKALHISINSSSTMVACNMMTWHSENEMNCHSTWFTIDRKHLLHDPKTYALSNKSAARACAPLLFVGWFMLFYFFFVFAHFVPQVVAHLIRLIFFCIQLATQCCQRPHFSLSPCYSIVSCYIYEKRKWILFAGGCCQVLLSRYCSYAHANAMRKSSSPLHVLL